VLVTMATAGGACGGGSSGATDSTTGASDGATIADATTAPVDPASRPCSEERHMVVFDFFGSLNGGIPDLARWIGDEATPPTPRPGAAAVATAYRDRGYEVLYLTLAPVTSTVDGVPLIDAANAWLAANGFPTGPGTQVWAWDGQAASPQVRAIDELIRLGNEGVSIDAAYTDNVDKANALISGGVPADHLFALDAATGRAGSTPVPGNDLAAHAGSLQTLARACQPG
jgi:hypothetical protein